MRFFHISDLHIGLKLMNRDLRKDQEYILETIVEKAIEKKPDAVLIAGDIYDKAVPSSEAVDVFDNFISNLSKALPNAKIMMISGNHDSASRINVFRNILSSNNIYMIGIPPRFEDEYIEKVSLSDEYGKVNFYLLPFVKPSMVKEIVGVDENGNNLSYDETLHRLIKREKIDCSDRNVLVSHQFYLPKGKSAGDIERSDSEIKTVGNIDQVNADILEIFDYAALGHIHKKMKVGYDNYLYSGTPIATSVSESGQEKSITYVNMGEKGDIKIENIPLIPLRNVKIITGELEKVLQEACEDYVTIVLTDKKDLDVIDMQDRLRAAFPNLLEIRRTSIRKADYRINMDEKEELDAYNLCNLFLSDLDEEEQIILKEVINELEL
ncbi:Exodeoxyribonuclease I subunit D [Acetitomaculum ruminis DSM 5522]|uniref:Nuclease SbcCD subunit D n=1 Tax=Acetitomaculum ruminis DSM 5522 TaxID=1120918 RepID=A0A1I0V318_9FIRM|nr:exonuclease SbcCD subunit D [Acetitomaculum ruminis]SFA70759.1 Exodeoxyribonuclease I subunit D [Acetitomaculum ruminis DSM 5522]